MKNYYQILGVSPSASVDEIKRSYRVLAKRYHPDVNPNDKSAADKFADVNEAHDTLSDPTKRAEYDKQLKEASNSGRADILARQRAAAQQAAAQQAAARQAAARQAAARQAAQQAAMRSAFGGRIDPLAMAQARAQAAAQQAAAQQAAQAQVQAHVNAATNQAYKSGYDKGVTDGKAAASNEISNLKTNISNLNDEIEKLRRELEGVKRDRSELEKELFNRDRELEEVRNDRSELEQELFKRDRELTEAQTQADTLEKKVEQIRESAEQYIANDHERASAESSELQSELERANERIKQLEQEKRRAEMTNTSQIELQQENRRKMQTEIDALQDRIAVLEEELEAAHAENEQWQQYAKSEEFINDAEARLQEWDKKQKADKKLAKNTLYGTLGTLIWALPEEIEDAYTKLQRRYSSKPDAESMEKLDRLNEAYATLSDPEARREYNKTIDITDERIEEERRLIEENLALEDEYRSQLESKEFWEQFDEIMLDAQTGDAAAQNSLGEMYYYGDEIEQDIDQAVYWFKEAAKQKHADGMYNLGLCFLNGDGVTQNKVTGLGFIKQAAKLGSVAAADYMAAEEKQAKKTTGK